MFSHNFLELWELTFSVGTVDATVHYFRHCPNFSNERLTFFNKFQSIDENILSKETPTFQKCFSMVINHLVM